MSRRWQQPWSSQGVFLILRQGAPLPGASPSTAAKRPQAASLPKEQHQPQSTPTTRVEPEGPRLGSGICRCTVDGATVCAEAPCPHGKAIDIRIVEWFRPSNAAVHRPAAPSTETRVQSSDGGTNQSASVGASQAARCAQLPKQIDDIDALVRRGGSAAYQDRLREERRKLVDKRYKSKC